MANGTRKVAVTIVIDNVPLDVSDVQVSTLVENMIRVGQADAAESAEDEELDNTEDAELASNLEIEEVFVKD
jgi:hypothetical protein